MSQYHRILFLLILPCFVASCNGQGKTQQETAGGIKINPEGKSKLDFSEADGHFDPVYGNVHRGFRDNAGNLWFGTRGMGLCRYDGKLFTNFTGHK
jgi:hypothetical protein